jgi:hypothetical protein
VQRDAGIAVELDEDVAQRAQIGPVQEHRIGSYAGDRSMERCGAMRKIINSTYISLDGVVERPRGRGDRTPPSHGLDPRL